MEGWTLTYVPHLSTVTAWDIPTSFCKVMYNLAYHSLMEFTWPHIFSDYFILVISLEVKRTLHINHVTFYETLHCMFIKHWHVYECKRSHQSTEYISWIPKSWLLLSSQTPHQVHWWVLWPQSSENQSSCHLEMEMATHSSILAWRIPWTEEPGKATVHGVTRVRHLLVTELPPLSLPPMFKTLSSLWPQQ